MSHRQAAHRPLVILGSRSRPVYHAWKEPAYGELGQKRIQEAVRWVLCSMGVVEVQMSRHWDCGVLVIEPDQHHVRSS